MRQTFAVILLLMLSVTWVAAQSGATTQPQPEAKPATREQVLRLMEALNVRAQMTLMISGVQKEFEKSFVATFQKQLPGAPPEVTADVVKLMAENLRLISVEELCEAMVPIYQKYLTAEEVEATIQFYSSPVGKALLQKMPAMLQEGMQLGSSLTQNRIGKVEETIGPKLLEIIKKHCGKEACPEWTVPPKEGASSPEKAPAPK